ncbi:MAG: hypothetical protein IPK97_05940 [Ahniella sp.]|nr:hypothetical protein [Ahniella sp.]
MQNGMVFGRSFVISFMVALVMTAPVVSGQTRVVVPSAGSSTVQVVDLDAGAVVTGFSVGGDAYGTAVQRDGRRSYAAQVHANQVSAVDVSPPGILTQAQNFTMHGAAVSPDGRTLYLTVRDGGQAVVLDAATLAESSRINGLSNPGGIFADPQGRYLAISNYGVPRLTLVDLASGLQRHAQLPGTGGWAITGTPSGGRLYVQLGSGFVAEVDPILGGTIRSVSAPAVLGSLALTPNGANLYLATQGPDLIHWDTQTMTPLAPIATGGAVSVDVSPDGSRAWVSRGANQSLTAYSTSNDAVVADIPVPGITLSMGRFIAATPGSTANWDLDDSGQGLLGQPALTLPSDASFVSGAIGRGALSCPVSGISADLPAPPANGAFTLSLWIRPTMLPIATAFIAGQAGNSAPQGWWLGLRGDRLRITGFSVSALEASAPVRAGNWHHAVVTVDSMNVSLFLDGVPAGSTTRVALDAASTPLRFCADPVVSTEPFNGAIDAATLYNRALPSLEVQAIRAASPQVATQTLEPGFEQGAVDTQLNNIPGWRFATYNRNDFGDYGSSPTGQWDARIATNRRHRGDASLRSYVRNNAGGGPTDANGRKATLVMGLPDDTRLTHRATHVELWRSDWDWTASSRWYHSLTMTLGDNRGRHETLLYCRAWGANEGCTGNFFDGSDLSETGADGTTWYRHRVEIPPDLDRERLWIRIEHQQDAWDGTSAESSVHLDDLALVGTVVGEELATASFGNNSVQFHARGGDGNLVPTRTIAGPLTTLNQPNGVAFGDDVIFVGNHGGQSIAVFSRDASGNVAPIRVIAGPSTGLGLVTHLRVFDGELFVASYGAPLRVFDVNASGDVAPTRVLPAMTGVYGMAIDEMEMYLSRHPDTGDNTIYVYARTASGSDAPTRTIAGQFLNFPSGPALTRTELIVSDYFNNVVRVFDRTASGAVAALRVFSDGTGLFDPADVWVRDNEIYVAARSSNSLRVYGVGDVGAVIARRVIGGAGTGLDQPLSVVDSSLPRRAEFLFQNGFE